MKRNPTSVSASRLVTALLLGALPAAVSAQTIRFKSFESVSPNEKVRIVSKCDGQRQACNVSAHAGGSAVEIGPRDYPSGPGIRWVNLDTAAVDFACGEGCRTTWFFNPRLGRSAPYRHVLAVDGVRMRVAVDDPAREEIDVLPIGTDENATPSCRVPRRTLYGGTADTAARRVVFDSEGNLKLHDGSGAVIPIDRRSGTC